MPALPVESYLAHPRFALLTYSSSTPNLPPIYILECANLAQTARRQNGSQFFRVTVNGVESGLVLRIVSGEISARLVRHDLILAESKIRQIGAIIF